MTWVTIRKASELIGQSENAIRHNIRLHWVEGVHYIKNHGRVWVSIEEYQKWVAGEAASKSAKSPFASDFRLARSA